MRRLDIAGEAMDYSARGREPGFAHDFRHAPLALAAVDHDWQSEVGGEFQMAPQRRFLRVARRVHVVEIEAGLSDRDDFLRSRQLAAARRFAPRRSPSRRADALPRPRTAFSRLSAISTVRRSFSIDPIAPTEMRVLTPASAARASTCSRSP